MNSPLPTNIAGDVIHGAEWGASTVLNRVQRALELSEGATPRRFPGCRIAALFLNPSLRTKTSLEFAADAVGAKLVSLNAGQGLWQIEHQSGATMNADKAEHISEVAGDLSQMAHVLALRTFASLEDKAADLEDQNLQSFIRYATKPVINLESALWHPLQGFADTSTRVRRLGPDLRGKRLTLTWAPHPKALPTAVANQVLLSLALQGMAITLAHPEPFVCPASGCRLYCPCISQWRDVTLTHQILMLMMGHRSLLPKVGRVSKVTIVLRRHRNVRLRRLDGDAR